MARLRPKQWDAIEKRLLAGESNRSVAKDFDVSETAIRKHFGGEVRKIQSVAEQIVEVDKVFKSLTIGSQVRARTLADEMIAISTHLAGAAKFGSITSHRISGMAHDQLDKINEADIEGSAQVLQNIARLIALSNESAKTGLALLAANKDLIKSSSENEDKKVHTINIVRAEDMVK